MAKWSVTASTPSESVAAQQWARFAHSEARIRTFWADHLGMRTDGMGQFQIIEIDERLSKEKGDAVNTNLVMDLDDDGISGNAGTALETNEADDTVYSDSVLIGRHRQAVRSDGVLDEQRAAYDMRAVMAEKLAYWAQRVLMDKWIFRKLSGTSHTDKNSAVIGEAAATNSNILYAGGATALGGLESNMGFTMDLLTHAKTAAMIGQLNGSTIYKMKPYIIGGRYYYLYVDRPEVRQVIRDNDDWRTAQLNARERSAENPIFSGADGVWDGVIMKFHDLVTTGSDAGVGGNVSYSNGLFLGTQAGTLYPAQEAPDWVEKTFDYGEEWGLATGMTQGFDKLRYNSIDFAVICIRSAIPSV